MSCNVVDGLDNSHTELDYILLVVHERVEVQPDVGDRFMEGC